jgi:hypothetical protein
VILAAVIHKQELVGSVMGRKRLTDCRGERHETLCFIIGGNDEGEFWGG